ncbi:MAG: hypothetical protein BAJATHORv1_20396 [Candidatus Thorarchaeota archaeon]|nr:MAG: hypothetical protein BAJATHORv1_20396 [Candidatus Thorarchaeota archaeon]
MYLRILNIFGGSSLFKHAIEERFPVSKVNKIAEKESTGFGRRHYRPVYVMHKWWARRLGCIFRAIVLYTLSESTLENIWECYSKDVDFSNKIILDPMMGGGTSIVEALRFGCNVVGKDLNPVAWFVVKKQIEDIDLAKFSNAQKDLDRQLGEELREYYVTECPFCKEKGEGIYYFHVKEIYCEECKEQVPLMRNFVLAKSISKKVTYIICPDCYEIFHVENPDKTHVCPRCKNNFHPKNTSNIQGRSYVCPQCDMKKGIVETIRKCGKPDERLFAIEYYCKKCDEDENLELSNGRGYKSADSVDLQLYKEAAEEYHRIKQDLPIPDTMIPKGVETQRALNHGYLRFRDMFNPRQLLNLGKILRWILDMEDWDLKEFFLLAFSNSLKYNNTFCKYNATRGFITDIFRTHSFSPSFSPVEVNCYDIPKGRGSFTTFLNLIIEAKRYCATPFERVFEKGRMHKKNLSTPIRGDIVDSFSDLRGGQKAILQCGSSTHFNMPSESVDVVITDPPYADNVMYSELSNFFYVWLRKGLHDRYSHFRMELVPWQEEVIENRVQEKGNKEYLSGLIAIFSEMNRLLKKTGVMVFTFHHKKLEAWESILKAILEAGFFISATHPVRSEMRASTHLYQINNITIDMIIVCRKRKTAQKPKTLSQIRYTIIEEAHSLLTKLEKTGKSIDKPDVTALVLGKSMEVYSRYFSDSGSEEISIQDILSLSDEIVTGLSK